MDSKRTRRNPCSCGELEGTGRKGNIQSEVCLGVKSQESLAEKEGNERPVELKPESRSLTRVFGPMRIPLSYGIQ